MLSRRIFVKNLAAGTGAVWLTTSSWGQQSTRQLNNVGFIAGIVNKELKEDWKATLKKAVDFGFNEIETGNYYGDSPASFLAYCQQIGLKPIGGGLPVSTDNDKIQKRLDQLAELKVAHAVVYWPWLVGGPFKLDDCKRSADLLNNMGEVAKERGLTLCWHNHDKEFTPMEAGLPFDYLMAHTDPALVKCELDLYWVAKGGADPLTMLQKYKGRYAILHVKDMAPGAEKTFECPGSGTLNFPALFAEAQLQGIRHYMVERDNVVDGLACLQSSGQYLRNLRF